MKFGPIPWLKRALVKYEPPGDLTVGFTEFFGTSGTIGEVNILAGSPQAWGQAKFLVVVAPSKGDGPPVSGAKREDRP